MNPPREQWNFHPTFLTSEWGTRLLIGLFAVWVIETIIIGIFREPHSKAKEKK